MSRTLDDRRRILAARNRDEAPLATGATAGTPGTFTPAGSRTPANLAEMSGVVASPATAWTTGQHVVTGDAAHVHWSATAWTAGDAAARSSSRSKSKTSSAKSSGARPRGRPRGSGRKKGGASSS